MVLKFGCTFPGISDSKRSSCNAGDLGSIPGLERSPGEGNGNPLQYSCLENFMDRGPVHRLQSMGCKELDMTEWLNTRICRKSSGKLWCCFNQNLRVYAQVSYFQRTLQAIQTCRQQWELPSSLIPVTPLNHLLYNFILLHCQGGVGILGNQVTV